MNPELPLFPLHTVLFPGGRLELRIFEPRYVDLVRDCLREARGFGVCLIREGFEAGAPAKFAEVGTSARIVDWTSRPDGLLGITVVGERRFRVLGSRLQRGNLILGEVEWLVEPPSTLVGSDHVWLRELFPDGEVPDGDAAALAFRIAESIPLPAPLRQELLEIDAPLARLDRIGVMLQPLLTAAPGRGPG